MRIFVTGATGFIGFAVATNLARAGHKVYGLARSAEKAQRLSAAEVLPVTGDMSRPETYLEAASRCHDTRVGYDFHAGTSAHGGRNADCAVFAGAGNNSNGGGSGGASWLNDYYWPTTMP